MKISLLLIFFTLTFGQNIITSWNYDKVAMYDIQKINKFLLSEFGNKPFELPNIISWNNIIIKNITLIDIEANLYDSFLNYNNGLFLFTPNKLTLYFNFSYSESTKGYNDTAVLELKIGTLKIKVKNDKIKRKPYISAKMSSPVENYNVPGIKDKKFLELLLDSLYSGFQMQSILSRTISDKISSGLLKYFNDFYSQKKEFSIQANEFFGNFKFPMNNNEFLYFCEDLLGEYKNSFCYYLGYSDKEEEIKDKTKVPLSNERFSHNNNNLFNLFINKDLIDDVINYVTNNYFYFNPKIYNNKTNIKHLNYDFTISSLKKYFNGLQIFKDDDYFYCEVYIDKFTLNEANYRVKFIIDNLNYNYYFIININSTINIDLPIIKNVRFNLCLNQVKTTKVEVIYSSSELKIDIRNIEELKNIIDESFDFDDNKICFSDNGISMRDYFAKIKNIYFREEGIYLEGEHIYQ